MAVALVPQHLLAPRSYYGGDWSGGARWAFFAIFVLVIIAFIFGTIRVNKSRSRQGMSPLYGTRWMTPPSYYQSQGQYNQPTRRDPDMPNVYVPEYSEQANDNDMGYYDNEGNFHANPNAKGPLMPEPAHHRTMSHADGHPVSNIDDEEDGNFYRRPAGSPPNTGTSTTGTFERPSNPPPHSQSQSHPQSH